MGCILLMGFPGDSVIKTPPANAGDMGSTPGSGRSPGEGNGHPLQHSCLGNPMDGGAWWAIIHGVTKELDTIQQQNNAKAGDFTLSQHMVPGDLGLGFTAL